MSFSSAEPPCTALQMRLRKITQVHGISWATIECRRDLLSDSILIECVTRAPSAELVEFKHPDGWWQAFKSRWFPRWMKRRWPVQMIVHRVGSMFPDNEFGIPPRNKRDFCVPICSSGTDALFKRLGANYYYHEVLVESEPEMV
jgi:hypothetical protein